MNQPNSVVVPCRPAASRIVRAGALAALALLSLSAQACPGDEPYMGSVCVTAANFCPRGYLPANGQVLQINQYQALFSLLGNTYGGSISGGTFALPNLGGRSAVGSGPLTGTTSVYQLGQPYGAETVALTTANIAPHTHPATTSGAGSITGKVTLPLAASAAVPGQNVSGAVTVNALNGSTAPTGGVPVPSSTANTVGKIGLTPAFFPPASAVAVPSSHNLTVPATTAPVTGNASGDVNLPLSGIAMTVGANAGGTPVATLPPRLPLTTCVAVLGIFPPRP